MPLAVSAATAARLNAFAAREASPATVTVTASPASVSQTPQAESEVAVDDLVTLRVSTGPEAAPIYKRLGFTVHE